MKDDLFRGVSTPFAFFLESLSHEDRYDFIGQSGRRRSFRNGSHHRGFITRFFKKFPASGRGERFIFHADVITCETRGKFQDSARDGNAVLFDDKEFALLRYGNDHHGGDPLDSFHVFPMAASDGPDKLPLEKDLGWLHVGHQGVEFHLSVNIFDPATSSIPCQSKGQMGQGCQSWLSFPGTPALAGALRREHWGKNSFNSPKDCTDKLSSVNFEPGEISTIFTA